MPKINLWLGYKKSIQVALFPLPQLVIGGNKIGKIGRLRQGKMSKNK